MTLVLEFFFCTQLAARPYSEIYIDEHNSAYMLDSTLLHQCSQLSLVSCLHSRARAQDARKFLCWPMRLQYLNLGQMVSLLLPSTNNLEQPALNQKKTYECNSKHPLGWSRKTAWLQYPRSLYLSAYIARDYEAIPSLDQGLNKLELRSQWQVHTSAISHNIRESGFFTSLYEYTVDSS